MWFSLALLAVTLQHPMLVSTDWLAGHLQDPLVVIVEVGTRADYDSAHIPGARFIDAAEIVAECDGLANEIPAEQVLVDAFTRAGVGDAKRVIVYSRRPLLAARAWFTLDYLGHGSRASLLDGGWDQWILQRNDISTTAFPVKPAPFTVLPRSSAVASFDEMRDLVRRRGTLAQKLVTVDSRPPLSYRAGHLPDAVSIPWTENLVSERPALFRDAEALRRIYNDAGIDRDAIVVTYCRTGMEASMTYFVLRYLGYDATLYDGSFVQWGASKDTVVVASD